MGSRRSRRSVASLLRHLFVKPTERGYQPPPLRLVRTGSLDQVLSGDRIVQNLLAGQIVDRREVFTAWAHKQDFQDPRALWRVLTDVQGTNSSRIFRAVARYYSFQEAHISMVGTQTLVIQNRNLFTDLEWRRMVELGVFPVREKNDALDDGVRWTFASFDPSGNAVRTFVSSTSRGRSFLKYAPLATLFEVVNNCTGFPKLDALPWYRKYVLGRLPISLRPLPDSGDVRRAA